MRWEGAQPPPRSPPPSTAKQTEAVGQVGSWGRGKGGWGEMCVRRKGGATGLNEVKAAP